MWLPLFCFVLGILFFINANSDEVDESGRHRQHVGLYNLLPQISPWKYIFLGVFMIGVGIYHLIYSVDW